MVKAAELTKITIADVVTAAEQFDVLTARASFLFISVCI
jgi:hypothetical protein